MSNQSPNVKVLIMAGGKGTRMWPISNMAHPKQFESILGNQSMFRETVERVMKGYSPEDIYVATSAKFAKHIRTQAEEIPAENFIFEPAMRDNLGALGVATSIIHHRHPDSVMLLLWGADHLIKDVDNFLSAFREAAKLAKENDVMVLVDTLATYPTVHNGWIEIGDKIKRAGKFDVFKFVRQVEKPDLSKAQEFYASNKYLIHTGYMATKPGLLLNHYRDYAPQTYAIMRKIASHIDTPDFAKILEEEYPKFEKLSVDYGLYEKLPPETQWEMPADFGWVDVGTWELLYHGLDKDDNGNVLIGSAHLIDTRNSLIISNSGSTLGVIGLNNCIVVETADGMLVCPLDQAPKVKDLYHELNRQT